MIRVEFLYDDRVILKYSTPSNWKAMRKFIGWVDIKHFVNGPYQDRCNIRMVWEG